MKFITLVFIYLWVCSGTLNAQSLIEDANLSSETTSSDTFFSETIKIISGSKKIFIITNNNQQLGPGDFVSLALDNNLAARGLVVKSHQGMTGVKILKIYSLSQWSRLRKDVSVQIIKGDDSRFGKSTAAEAEEAVKSAESIPKIKNEEDLFKADVVSEEDSSGVFEENANRHIKPDNVVGVTGSFLTATQVASRGGSQRATEFGFSWAFQFSDNYFIEGIYGRALLDGFPGDGMQTLVNHLTGRLKVNIKGPLYTFIMPYVGFHSYTVSSPDAAKTNNASTNAEQQEAIDNLKKQGPVFGVTLMRRLVPGWFVKTDLGTDIINLGFAIEF
jgi:hypothetical protein